MFPSRAIHGVTEKISLCLPRMLRISRLKSPWIFDIEREEKLKTWSERWESERAKWGVVREEENTLSSPVYLYTGTSAFYS